MEATENITVKTMVLDSALEVVRIEKDNVKSHHAKHF